MRAAATALEHHGISVLGDQQRRISPGLQAERNADMKDGRDPMIAESIKGSISR